MRSTTPRTLCAALPHATPGDTVRLQGWVHRRRELAALTFLVVRDRTGLAQVVVKDARTEVPPEETVVEVVGTLTANDAAPGGVEVTDPQVRPLTEPAATPPVELWRPTLNASLPTLLDHAAGHLAAPARSARPGELAAAALRGFRSTLDDCGLHRDPDPEDRGLGDRVRRQRVRARLLRPTGVPRPEPAVLQADDGRRLRARLRGRAGVPGRAARHRPPPGRVRLARRRARLHRATTGTCWRCCGRSSPGWSTRCTSTPAARSSGCPSSDCRRCRTRSRCSTSPRRSRWSARRADEPDLAPEHERALGEWALAEHGSDFVAVDGLPDAQAAVLHPPAARRTRAGRTASTCCSAGWSWSPAGSGCTGTRTTSRRSARAARTRPTYAAYLARRSGTGCRRTAASRSGWSAGWPGWSRRPTSARSRCSRATSRG